MAKVILSGNIIFNQSDEILLLYRKQHGHYETPGGKLEKSDCKEMTAPTVHELEGVAYRELHEELGDNFEVSRLKYFGSVEFTIPDGREAVAHKFISRIISGTPIVNEPELFSEIKYFSISELGTQPISPDLKLFLERLLAYKHMKE